MIKNKIPFLIAEISANHCGNYNLAKKLFPQNINIQLLSSKSEKVIKKNIIENLKNNKINMVF